jgi:hypothetical protein
MNRLSLLGPITALSLEALLACSGSVSLGTGGIGTGGHGTGTETGTETTDTSTETYTDTTDTYTDTTDTITDTYTDTTDTITDTYTDSSTDTTDSIDTTDSTDTGTEVSCVVCACDLPGAAGGCSDACNTAWANFCSAATASFGCEQCIIARCGAASSSACM